MRSFHVDPTACTLGAAGDVSRLVGSTVSVQLSEPSCVGVCTPRSMAVCRALSSCCTNDLRDVAGPACAPMSTEQPGAICMHG
jgi:hypothetical protein